MNFLICKPLIVFLLGSRNKHNGKKKLNKMESAKTTDTIAAPSFSLIGSNNYFASNGCQFQATSSKNDRICWDNSGSYY